MVWIHSSKSDRAGLERLNNGKARWEQTAEHLKAWTEKDITPNQVIWDIEKFADRSISEEELVRLQEGLKDLQEELEDQRQEADLPLYPYGTFRRRHQGIISNIQ